MDRTGCGASRGIRQGSPDAERPRQLEARGRVRRIHGDRGAQRVSPGRDSPGTGRDPGACEPPTVGLDVRFGSRYVCANGDGKPPQHVRSVPHSTTEAKMKRPILLALASLVLLVGAALAIADDAAKSAAKSNAAAPAAAAAATPAQAAASTAEHRTFLPGDFKWVDAPAGLPKGAKMAVIHGDPSAPGLFAMRATLPAGYKVPPHFHPADENVTVISGELYMGMGDTWDESKGHALPQGSVSIM